MDDLIRCSVGGTTIVGGSGHTITSALTAAIVPHLALLELARVGAVPLLLFFLQVSALGHAELRALISTFILLKSIH